MFFIAAAYVLVGAMGLALGSFGNVLLHRIHSGESLHGRSHCPHCRRSLQWIDMIPVLSFVLLGGRCRKCRKPISMQYPLVELGSLAVFLFAFHIASGDPVDAVLTGIVLYFLLLACVYDALYQQLPDAFTVCIAVAAVIDVALGGSFHSAIAGAVAPFFWFGMQWALSRGRAVGTGDIFLGTTLGFFLGGYDALVMLILSYMTGAVIISVLLATGRLQFGKKRIAFGPFLGIATVLTLMGAGRIYIGLLS